MLSHVPPGLVWDHEYTAGHTRGRPGRIDYRAADLGLDRDELRQRFAADVERVVR